MGIPTLTSLDWGLLVATLIYSLNLSWKIWSMVYPGGPKPVPEGEIEDAVLIYTWSEAFEICGTRLRILYTLALLSILLLVT